MGPRHWAARAAARAALFVGALAASVCAIELALDPIFEGTSSPQRFRIPHPVFGWSLEPGASYVHGGLGYRVAVSYNARGWRDLPRAVAKPEGVFRIVVLGDSHMEAYSVELEEAFHRQLEERLAATGRRVEVINLGVGGFGTLQELLVLEEEGLRYDPDLVLLAFNFGNDILNNSKDFETRQLGRGHVKVAFRPFLEPGAGPYAWVVSAPEVEDAKVRFARALRKSRKRPWWTRTSIARLFRQADIDDRWTQFLEERGWSRRPAPVEVECEGQAEYEEAWRTTERILVRLEQVSRSHGAAFFVFTVPKAYGHQHLKLRLRWKRGDRVLCWDRDPAWRLAAILERSGTPLLDLGPVFASRSGVDGQRLIVRGEGHWNARGHALAAERVAIALEERGLLPE